jgi:phosphomannomutase
MTLFPLEPNANTYLHWPQTGIDKLSMVASTVSSKMIEAIAAAEGFKFADCLTGSYSLAL